MKKIVVNTYLKNLLLTIIILALCAYVNMATSWGIGLNIQLVPFFWAVFFFLILPHILVKQFYRNSPRLGCYIANSIVVYILYMTSVLIGAIHIADFLQMIQNKDIMSLFYTLKNISVIGDGASRVLVLLVLAVSSTSILLNIIYFGFKQRKQ